MNPDDLYTAEEIAAVLSIPLDKVRDAIRAQEKVFMADDYRIVTYRGQDARQKLVARSDIDRIRRYLAVNRIAVPETVPDVIPHLP